MTEGLTRREPSAGIRTSVLLLLVALAGAATMVIELGAVRLLAPWFGTSSSVWTNVIGVVLAALALGYALGARLASGASPQRALAIVLLLGAAFAAWLPMGAGAIARWFMPEGVALHDAAELLVWGSLAAAAVLFLPAAATLGCAGPLAVEALQRSRGGSAGRAGGHVLAASTVGSLGGTFGTTHVFIPTLGVTGTFLAAALALALSGALLLLARGGGRPRWAAPGLLIGAALGGGLLALGQASTRPARDGETLLASVDSSLQSLRVVESGVNEERMRFLRVNESLDSFQSVWQPATGLLGGGHYYDYFGLPYAWRTRELGEPPPSWNVLILGLGAGTAVRVLEGIVDERTQLRTVGIEIDPEVVRLGKTYFDLASNGDARVAVGGLDGRAALRYAGVDFDQIIVDAYANNMEIPPHLASTEAFAEMSSLLKEGGWVSINVGGFGFDDPVVEAVAAAAAVGMQEPVSLGRVAFSRNLSLTLRKDERVPRPGTSEFGSRGRALPGGLASLTSLLVAPGAWEIREVEALLPAARSDDRSSMEELQLRSIREAAVQLNRLDDATGDGTAVAAGDPEFPTADDEGKATAADRLSRGEDSDLALAFQAAEEIDAEGLRARTRANLLWGAGDLFGALEEANEALRWRPDDLAALLTAVNLGLIVGASDAAGERLRRAQSLLTPSTPGAPVLSDEARTWWSERFEGLQTQQDAAEKASAAQHRAVRRSRWAALMAGGVALGLILILLMTGTPAGHSPESLTTG